MKVNCILIEDDEPVCDLLVSYIEDNKRLTLIGKFNHPSESLQTLDDEEVHAIVLDIKFHDISGIDFIKGMENPPLVIFVTSHPQFAIEGYDVNAVDFLVKPISEERLNKAIDKLIEIYNFKKEKQIQKKSDDQVYTENYYFYIKPDSHYVKIKFDDVIYFEAMVDYVKLHTVKESYLINASLKKVSEVLPESVFIRVQRGYIVNESKISSFSNTEVRIDNVYIPLGKSYKEKVMKRLMKNNAIRL
jgi:DNA-binding LytR/AlgR family response regulator